MKENDKTDYIHVKSGGILLFFVSALETIAVIVASYSGAHQERDRQEEEGKLLQGF